MDILIEEINASATIGLSPLKTLYFGGGTPSLIPPQQLARLIRALDKRFGIAAGAEVSMEADPGTFDAERLRQYMSLGLSRFSVGVQAFQEVCSITIRPSRILIHLQFTARAMGSTTSFCDFTAPSTDLTPGHGVQTAYLLSHKC